VARYCTGFELSIIFDLINLKVGSESYEARRFPIGPSERLPRDWHFCLIRWSFSIMVTRFGKENRVCVEYKPYLLPHDHFCDWFSTDHWLGVKEIEHLVVYLRTVALFSMKLKTSLVW